jgi:chemotaxis signal transduction protein
MDRRDFIAFTVSGRSLALPVADVRRAVPLPRLAAPAGAPAFLEGFFNLHGSEVAVLRADLLLDLGEEQLGVYSPLLLLAGDDPLMALHVGRITGIAKAADVKPVGKDETFNSAVVGRFDHGGQSTYLLSARQILLAEERSRVAFHRDVMRRRLDGLGREPAGARRAS